MVVIIVRSEMKMRLFCCCVLLVIFPVVFTQQPPFFDYVQQRARVASASVEQYSEVLNRYHGVRNLLKDNPEILLDVLGNSRDVPWNANVSRACADDMSLIIAQAQNKQMWAFQFLDASGKPEAGILQGNFQWLGSFDECRAIEAVTNNATDFRGKYCLAAFGPYQNTSGTDPAAGGEMGAGMTMLALKIGFCYPDSCTDEDTFYIASNLLTMIPTNLINMTLEVYSSTCQPRYYEYDTKAIALLCVIGFFGMLITIGTLYDVFIYRVLVKNLNTNPADITSVTTISATTTAVMYPPIGHGHPSTDSIPYVADISASDDAPTTTVIASDTTVHTNGDTVHQHTEVEKVETDADDAPLLGSKETLIKEKVTVETVKIVPVHEQLGVLSDILLAFSLYGNGKKILDTCSTNDRSLSCIHGIRFLSMTWVLLGHTYGFGFMVIRNLVVVEDVLGNFWFQAIANATVSVDTFFTMSGLLVCYLFVLNYEKTKKFPVIQYYIHRYWRLTAVYAVIMGVYLSLFKYLNIGPMWNPNGMEVDSCSYSWWTNLLYVNNLVRTSQQCMGWTWYLANDMQFYWVTPLILLPLVKLPIAGFVSMGIFMVAHLASTAVISAEYHVNPSILGNGGDLTNMAEGTNLWDYFNRYYIKPWCRMGPYIIGLLFGYLLAKYKEKPVRMSLVTAFFIWIVAAVSATAVLYGLWHVNQGEESLDLPASVTYNTLHRSVWALCVCWVIFACVQGYGGFVNTLLSWKAFIPLSRLTYCCYLIHIPIMMIYYLGLTTTEDFSHYSAVYHFFGTLLVTYGFAFIFTVGCESPLLALEKLIEKQLKRNTKKEE
ncbi:nose resistant to fluoxetine protein 6-like [Paramacrobiotus metropolitanus]|uniref:nose resistant to fluoxetine protein 6-like n=1 Tax=Paramacrobiotus metropolitanus TaxID=2943436 RepID=UPI0024465313|nr:nose resistant to fluoxetine protein 6-like [Paramacrobiotus metropolitanus]